MSSRQKSSFTPALIVVDVQEDFCPPNGSLPIPNGRDVIPFINELLHLPFALKIVSKDWHPENHVSFASNHLGKAPFFDMITITNSSNPLEKKEIRLWPNHCVAGTFGAEFVKDLHLNRVDMIIEKGKESSAEMYSVFYDMWGASSGLVKALKEKNITDVWVVGLALDYCVKETALHAAMEGFKTMVLKEATKATSDGDWGQIENDLLISGVKLVRKEDEDFVELIKLLS